MKAPCSDVVGAQCALHT